MVVRPSIVCPTDFSNASRGALRYAAAIAEHFYATLTVITVDDPLLADAASVTYGGQWMKAQTRQQLEELVKDTFRGHEPILPELNLDVATGKPAPEILRVASLRHADLIVMSTHGATGASKLFFGSTTERLLRETTIPVLVTPAEDPGPANLEDAKRIICSVLVPVDLTAATLRQVQIARGIAEALGVPLVLAHVLQPLHGYTHHHGLVSRIDTMRRLETDRALDELRTAGPPHVQPEIVLASGDPAVEIARIARERNAGVVVMGLHSSPGGGPRMGSVTYRVLCQIPTLVLAVPPAADKRASKRFAFARAAQPAPTV